MIMRRCHSGITSIIDFGLADKPPIAIENNEHIYSQSKWAARHQNNNGL